MKRLNVDDASKSVNILVISLNVLHNYFDIWLKCVREICENFPLNTSRLRM